MYFRSKLFSLEAVLYPLHVYEEFQILLFVAQRLI